VAGLTFTDLPFLDSVHLATLAVLDAIQLNLLEAVPTAANKHRMCEKPTLD
jgi:hypothetical protein